jgi:hypothetical protein
MAQGARAHGDRRSRVLAGELPRQCSAPAGLRDVLSELLSLLGLAGATRRPTYRSSRCAASSKITGLCECVPAWLTPLTPHPGNVHDPLLTHVVCCSPDAAPLKLHIGRIVLMARSRTAKDQPSLALAVASFAWRGRRPGSRRPPQPAPHTRTDARPPATAASGGCRR